MARKPAKFLRFVLQETDPDSGFATGPFLVASILRDHPETPDYHHQAIKEIIDWFNIHLEAPDRFNRTNSKGYWRRAAKGISWLKADATQHIEKMREMAAILEQYDHFVDQLETDRPGYIVYEDTHQVVAEPFADTPTD